MIRVAQSTCRSCGGFCPVNVTIENDHIIKVEGVPDAPLYEGFICPKGRALKAFHNDLDRLTHHQKRMPNGSFLPISSEQLIEEISTKLAKILKEHTPDAVAVFQGGPILDHQAMGPLANSFLQKIGSRSFYSNSTIDQPGILMANALHGSWAGGHPQLDNLDVLMLVGSNPIISKQYLGQNPGVTLRKLIKKGTKLIVIDPRRTETARRAVVHLQCIPGEDPTIIAGLIHLVIKHNHINKPFVELNTAGLDELSNIVKGFTPEYVAERAGINKNDLVEAANIIGQATSGDFSTGVGPSMATRGTLSGYLTRCLQTLRGFWPKEGEEATFPSVMMPAREFKAQPTAPIPAWGFGKKLRVRGLQETVAGMPAGALPEEILTPGEGQIRALFLHSGAMRTWPDTELTKKALESLDLMVILDVERSLSESAKVADYVIATKLQFEMPVISQFMEFLGVVQPGYGWREPYGSYHPALISPPKNTDLLEAWQVYYRIAQKLDIQLHCGGPMENPATATPLDMTTEPTTDYLYELMCKNAAIPLDEIKKFSNGHVFDAAKVKIAPRDADCDDRLELADNYMMNELQQVRSENHSKRRGTTTDYPFLLIPKRIQSITNSGHRPDGAIKTTYNPAYMHSSDLETLGLKPDDRVEISSRHGVITSFIDVDNDLRPGVLAICHGFGKNPGDKDYKPEKDGANVNQLTHWEDDFDPYNGMPRMGALPISIKAASLN